MIEENIKSNSELKMQIFSCLLSVIESDRNGEKVDFSLMRVNLALLFFMFMLDLLAFTAFLKSL